VPLAPALTPAPPQIAGNLKKYSKRYDEVDASLAAEADTALVAERAALMDDWLAWLRSKRQAMDSEEYRAALVALTGNKFVQQDADAYSNETVEVEELISMNEERLF
jgi:translation initiation factor 3 subunit B